MVPHSPFGKCNFNFLQGLFWYTSKLSMYLNDYTFTRKLALVPHVTRNIFTDSLYIIIRNVDHLAGSSVYPSWLLTKQAVHFLKSTFVKFIYHWQNLNFSPLTVSIDYTDFEIYLIFTEDVFRIRWSWFKIWSEVDKKKSHD